MHRYQGLQENSYFCITFFCGYQEECKMTGSTYSLAKTLHFPNKSQTLQWPMRLYMTCPPPHSQGTHLTSLASPLTFLTSLLYNSHWPLSWLSNTQGCSFTQASVDVPSTRNDHPAFFITHLPYFLWYLDQIIIYQRGLPTRPILPKITTHLSL